MWRTAVFKNRVESQHIPIFSILYMFAIAINSRVLRNQAKIQYVNNENVCELKMSTSIEKLAFDFFDSEKWKLWDNEKEKIHREIDGHI